MITRSIWLAVFACTVLGSAKADTIRLKRNVDINGIVTLSNENITIRSSFNGHDEQMTIGREHVTEIRFNPVVDNPGQPEGWMRTLQHRGGSSASGDDTLYMVDKKELREHVVEITSKEIVTTKGRYNRTAIARFRITSQ